MSLQSSWFGFAVSLLVFGLAACGGDGADASKCADGMLSSTPCSALDAQSCFASGGTTPVAMCIGGQWSRCGCAQGSTLGSQQGTRATSTGATCGNFRAEDEEQCDGLDLKGMTCATIGRASGSLRCNASCTFDASLCMGGSSSNGGTGASPPRTAGQGAPSPSLALSGLYEFYEDNIVDTDVGGTGRLTRYHFEPAGKFSVCRVKRLIVVARGSDETSTELNTTGGYNTDGGPLRLFYNDGTTPPMDASYDPGSKQLRIGGKEYTIATRHPGELCVKPGT